MESSRSRARLPEADLEICIRHILRTGSLAIAFAGSLPPAGEGRIAIGRLAPDPDPLRLFLVRRSGAASASARSLWDVVFPGESGDRQVDEPERSLGSRRSFFRNRNNRGIVGV